MDTKSLLIKYLEKATGTPIALRPLDKRRLTGLPALLVLGASFFETKWLAQSLVFAIIEPGKLDIPPREIAARRKRLAEHFQSPVVYVLPALDAYWRNSLVRMGVPFIVPGRQFFLPPLISLIEGAPRMEPQGRLSAPAQMAVLYQILLRPADSSLLSRWAEWLQYSVMTLSTVRNELVAHDLCVRESGERPRGLRFQKAGRDLWAAARPLLASPVRRIRRADIRADAPPLLKAGSTALAVQTMLNDAEPPTYACLASEWRGLVKAGALIPADPMDADAARIECWRYDPAILERDGLVDPLSLYLSLADNPDERVRLAADALLEKVEW